LTCCACSREWHKASRSSAYVERGVMPTGAGGVLVSGVVAACWSA
jgi:hypothetical protein